MKGVIKPSQAWAAVVFLGLLLTGCGGGGSDQGSQPSGQVGQNTVDRSATLSWNAPSEREDGTSLGLEDLQSYVISYGQDPENLERLRLEVEQDHQHPPLEYTFEDLADGEWHFSVQAQDQNGLMSPPSEVVTETI